MLKRFLAILTLSCTLGAVNAQAEEKYFDYKDWTVIIDSFDTGEDLRTECTIRTGGDGMPSLSATISNGDVLPPDYYPDLSLNETAPRGTTTLMQDGDPITFAFDDGTKIAATTAGWIDDDGIATARTQFLKPVQLQALQAMRHSSSVTISGPKGEIYIASASGFTAAYGKMAEQCGFTTEGVIK
jgi:hypothetical protein